MKIKVKNICKLVVFVYVMLCLFDYALENSPYAIGHLWQYNILKIFC